MTFGESIKNGFTNYATFDGRASRAEFWWWILFTFLVSMAAGAVSATLSQIFSLAVLLPSLAVSARRLHDTDRSAWFLLLWFIPVFGWIILFVWAIQHAGETNRYGPPA